MANPSDKVEKPKDRKETVNGREVQHFANGSASVYTDTGEEYNAAAAAEYALLYAGDDASKAKHEAVNAPILFWVKEFAKDDVDAKNPIRGFVLGFFTPPANFGTTEDEAADEEVVVRERLACWVKLTMPCMVKDQNKAIVLAPVGAIVWVDINASNTAVARCARPKEATDGGTPLGLVEVEIAPLRKVSFPSKTKKGETWSAWRMRVSGGWRQAADDTRSKRRGGFRMLDEAQVALLASRMVPPEILDVAHAAELAGVRAPGAPALPAAPARALAALPENASATQAN